MSGHTRTTLPVTGVGGLVFAVGGTQLGIPGPVVFAAVGVVVLVVGVALVRFSFRRNREVSSR